MTSGNVYLEIGPDSLKALAGDEGLELPLERLENRRLSPAQRQELAASLRDFLTRQGVRPGQHAFCAISARGVSLRRMTLPSTTRDELPRLLLLQIERQFPLPPDELAWGHRVVPSESGKTQEVVVVAVKKEVVQEYADLLAACSLNPEFTLGALARSALVPRLPASCAMLNLTRHDAELISFEQGAPSSIRVFPGTAVGAEFESLIKSIQAHGVGEKLYLSGEIAHLNEITSQLEKALDVACERIEEPAGPGRSASILGLKKLCEDGGALLLRLQPAGATKAMSRPASWKWAARAGGLILISFSLRYVEAFVQGPRLTHKISEIKSARDKLPQVDRELGFLQYLKTNQPPYLEPIFALANASPGGARIESLNLSRRGDLALRASMGNSQEVGDFRSKLINSGFFSAVVVEEQTPSPDKQKVVVRITGQWKPSGENKAPAAELAGKARSLAPAAKTADSPGAAMLPPPPTNRLASPNGAKE